MRPLSMRLSNLYCLTISLFCFTNIFMWIVLVLANTNNMWLCIVVTIASFVVMQSILKSQSMAEQTRRVQRRYEEQMYNIHLFQKETAVESTECTICLQEYTEGQSICTLPCGHMFHLQCMQQWNKSCPFGCQRPALQLQRLQV